ncbi:MAG: hypothetical protein HOP17_07605, partial [Acidobacteria bacterium]|nr:hypothetical protein [Acidobacteriota bacterium]
MSSATAKKEKFLDRLADDNGVAIIVVDADGNEASVSNNNSMCRSLYGSKEFAPECAKFCGSAFDKAFEAGKSVDYDCYAGLSCRAVPVWEGRQQFVAIVGRTFLKAERYRTATENAITGDWRQFKPTEFFENVLISGSSQSIDRVTKKLEKFSIRERNDILELDRLQVVEPVPEPPVEAVIAPPDPVEINNLIEKFKAETENAAAELETAASKAVYQDRSSAAEWRSLFGSLMKLEYRAACTSVLT